MLCACIIPYIAHKKNTFEDKELHYTQKYNYYYNTELLSTNI